ncbi:hypothetical protein [Lignipirellula cremea]|uniref:Uncharacterized protein n=1 Tax=Lignipirellula cremea TaxID=2528010 RepID=A0A518DUZ9_9BACT|nr:hypothetical protein [Lignipirellula cremea]QDU95665.1 hypothetical protein Pla8534_34820 [Lignipirellula cremea]
MEDKDSTPNGYFSPEWFLQEILALPESEWTGYAREWVRLWRLLEGQSSADDVRSDSISLFGSVTLTYLMTHPGHFYWGFWQAMIAWMKEVYPDYEEIKTFICREILGRITNEFKDFEGPEAQSGLSHVQYWANQYNRGVSVVDLSSQSYLALLKESGLKRESAEIAGLLFALEAWVRFACVYE